MEAIPFTTEDGEEGIPRSTVRAMEKFPKLSINNRGEGAESDRIVSFCAASKVDSALLNNEGDSVSESDKGDSAKKDEWTQEVDLSKISDATVRETDWSLLWRYSAMWSEERRWIAATEHRIVLKPGGRPEYKI